MLLYSLTNLLRRRRALAARVKDGAVVLTAAPMAARNRDNVHPYRADGYMLYLSGFAEPEAALVLIAQAGKLKRQIIFCREKNAAAERWDGARLGPRALLNTGGFDEAHPFSEFERRLPKLLAECDSAHFLPGADAHLDAAMLETAKTRRARHSPRPWRAFFDVSPHLDEMRLIKDKEEIALMRRAANITAEAHKAAMRAVKTAKREFEIEAALGAVFRKNGAAFAFPPIVAAGKNACVLHYVENCAAVRRGDLVLVDAGCEVQNYAADVTRVFPARGKFSAAQREFHNAVLRAQKAAIQAVRPGALLAAPERAAQKALLEGLRAMGLVKLIKKTAGRKKNNDAQSRPPLSRFYMHGIGHALGLDVHDPSGAQTPPRRFAAGMVWTVEPGLYADGADIPRPFRGMGVRIEDDILVTKSGRDNLTAAAPKSAEDIERWMA